MGSRTARGQRRPPGACKRERTGAPRHGSPRHGGIGHLNRHGGGKAPPASRLEQNLLQALLDHMPDLIYFKDAESRFLRVNQALADYVGLGDPAVFAGKTDFDIFPAEIAKELFAAEQRIIATGVPSVGVLEDHRLHAHRPCWLQSTKVPIVVDGRVQGIVGISRDVTDLQLAPERLEREALVERGLLHTLMDTSPDFIYCKDRASRFMQVNRAQAQYLGVQDPAEAIGKTDFDFYAYDAALPLYTLEQRIMEAGRPLIGEVEDQSGRAGQPCWLQSTKVPIEQDGQIVGLVGISRDITTLKRAEELLAREAAAADELAELRSGFVATVSHELRTPLTAIVGYAELLAAHWAELTDDAKQERIQRIVAAANRQRGLVEQLLLLSRLELGALTPVLDQVAIGPLAERAADEVRTSYRDQQVQCAGPVDVLV